MGLFFAGYIYWSNYIRISSQITFAGKVINSVTNEWPNNRLVLVFLNGREIGRTVTSLGEFAGNNEGKHDGLFVISIDNIYDLRPRDLNNSTNEFKFMAHESGAVAHWFEELEEGRLLTVPIPSKNAKYTLKIIEGDVSTLPPALLIAGAVSLGPLNNIIVSLDQDTPANPSLVSAAYQLAEMKTAVDTDAIDINRIVVPINNCGGSGKVTQRYVQSQTFIHEYQSEVGGRAGISVPLGWVSLSLGLQGKYGFVQGQVETRTVDTTLEAAAGTNQIYNIVWQEIWESGVGTVIAGQDVIDIPFRVKSNVTYNIDSNKIDCP